MGIPYRLTSLCDWVDVDSGQRGYGRNPAAYSLTSLCDWVDVDSGDGAGVPFDKWVRELIA